MRLRPGLSLGLFAVLLACLEALPAAFAGRVAPSGFVTPRRGPYAGKRIPFGDNSREYTRIAEYTVAQIEAFLQGKVKPPPSRELREFLAGK